MRRWNWWRSPGFTQNQCLGAGRWSRGVLSPFVLPGVSRGSSEASIAFLGLWRCVVPARTWRVPVPPRGSATPERSGGSGNGVPWISLYFGVSESKPSPSASIPITRVFSGLCRSLSTLGAGGDNPRRETVPLSPNPWGPGGGDRRWLCLLPRRGSAAAGRAWSGSSSTPRQARLPQGFPEAFCSGSPLSRLSRSSAPPRSDGANELLEELAAAPGPMLPLQAAAYTRGVITEGDGGCWHLPPT